MGLRELQDHVDVINQQMARYGVKFGIYKNGSYNERLFPFDPIPRIIEADEFPTLERGLAQCEGIRPPEGIYSHISGIDLVKGKNGV